jgi:tetratricopeptide (TPR) repeat protein
MSAKLHAFVAMPFGTKAGKDGQLIDFNRVYREYIEPALTAAGLECFRADEEQRAGDIRVEMFQELLMADLVVADLTIDNPNVWYELGVRHALRARGVVLVCGGQVTTAFDLYTDRKLRYNLQDGAPDPATLQADQRALSAMLSETLASWHGRKVSPVYGLLPHLQEPDWKSLRVGDVRAFWERHEAWEDRLDLARRTNQIGALLVLAEEAPIAAFRAQAWLRAGQALRKSCWYEFAIEHLQRAIAIEPASLRAQRELGNCLQRLALQGVAGYTLERAREHYRDLLEQFPDDVETSAAWARLDKDAWVQSWRGSGKSPAEMRTEAAYEDAMLRTAIDGYTKSFRHTPGHYYSGINALTLMHLYQHLTEDARYHAELATFAGAVRFAAQCEADADQHYWAKSTLGDLEVLSGTPATVKSAYREAIAKHDKDWFALESSRAQLQLLHDLGFRVAQVEAGLATFDHAMNKLQRPGSREPRHVLLFSGHMIDTVDRLTPRFTEDMVGRAAAQLSHALEELSANEEDVLYCQAANGGDLLFLEACQRRGVQCRVLLPFEEPDFIERSIRCRLMMGQGGAQWVERYYAAKSKFLELRIMPDELGPLPTGVDPFERCNLWLLYSALACGVEKVRFVTLWNGGGGDGPGGTAHMYHEVKRRTGRVTWIDTRQL